MFGDLINSRCCCNPSPDWCRSSLVVATSLLKCGVVVVNLHLHSVATVCAFTPITVTLQLQLPPEANIFIYACRCFGQVSPFLLPGPGTGALAGAPSHRFHRFHLPPFWSPLLHPQFVKLLRPDNFTLRCDLPRYTVSDVPRLAGQQQPVVVTGWQLRHYITLDQFSRVSREPPSAAAGTPRQRPCSPRPDAGA